MGDRKAGLEDPPHPEGLRKGAWTSTEADSGSVETSDLDQPNRIEPWSRLTAGVAAALLVTVAALLWSIMASRPGVDAFPGEIIVTFIGRTGRAIAGTSSVVGIDGEPDVGFRVAVTPAKEKTLTILGLVIFSSDKNVHPAGGGRWDTYDDNTRAIGVIRNGVVLNSGVKRMLKIEVNRPTVLELHLADGTMTTFWKYFVVRVEAAGGHVHSTLVEIKTRRIVTIRRVGALGTLPGVALVSRNKKA